MDDLQKERDALQEEKDSLLNEKGVLKDKNMSLITTAESLRRSLKKKDTHMKESLEHSTTQVNEYRVEVTSPKLELESLISRATLASNQKQESVATQMTSFQSASESECGESVVKTTVDDKNTEEACVIGPNLMEDRFTDLFENSSAVDSIGFRTPDEGDENGQRASDWACIGRRFT